MLTCFSLQAKRLTDPIICAIVLDICLSSSGNSSFRFLQFYSVVFLAFQPSTWQYALVGFLQSAVSALQG